MTYEVPSVPVKDSVTVHGLIFILFLFIFYFFILFLNFTKLY